MKAFVQVDKNNEFHNPNSYLAWRAFNHFGYETIKFKDEEVKDLEITKQTPVFAGVSIMKGVFNRLEVVSRSQISSYPYKLENWLGREVREKQLVDVIKNQERVFIKPLDGRRKSFDGFVYDKDVDLLKLSGHELKDYVFVSEVVNFLVEYRVFILHNKILDARKYKGSHRFGLDWPTVDMAIAYYKNYAPAAYCLDFGLTTENKTVLVEATDAWSFGHYGLDMVHYGRMLLERWFDITEVNRIL